MSGASDLMGEIETLGARAVAARAEIGRLIFGQEEVVEQVLVTLLSGGHALLVGVPGLGKTLLVETLGTVLGLAPKRVQFTPDLMPADITGSEVLDEDETGRRSFRFLPGPVFCQLLMADEINRASPRTQSALLQAMQEGRVAVSGTDHPLPRPFHVLATQNPIEQEGTYPLPEAQLDRFLLQVDVGYPDLDAERTMLLATTGADRAVARPVLEAGELVAAQALIRRVPVGRNRGRGDPGLGPRRPPGDHLRRLRPPPRRLGPRPPRRPGADARLPAPGPCWTAAWHRAWTTSRPWPSPCCATAWRSTSLPGRKASASRA